MFSDVGTNNVLTATVCCQETDCRGWLRFSLYFFLLTFSFHIYVASRICMCMTMKWMRQAPGLMKLKEYQRNRGRQWREQLFTCCLLTVLRLLPTSHFVGDFGFTYTANHYVRCAYSTHTLL